ncbi:MAG TPA: 2-oxoacid:acceptor oxidoreductase family protein [Planctomycetota bacterium]|nr:2-oxoacid:acceptor oxidoreductase family protein [Planctomycetota bacterium]
MKKAKSEPVKYPGVRTCADGSHAVVAMETAGSEAAGAYPITPATQMGEGWAAAHAAGKPNVNGRRLLFFEPEGEHAAAAVTAGMSLVGLRSANFSCGQGVAYMHESLYAAVGKRLTYVLNMACRAMTKQALNVHAGHDDYHAVDDTGFFQLFAKDVQEAADLNLIAHRIAELSLNPGICAQDGFLTSHVIETVLLPERELVKEYLGDPADTIETPTPAQRLVFGDRRRRIPELFDLDYPAMLGVVQNQDAYAQGVAAQRPFYFDHLVELTERAFQEYAALTGRRYTRAGGYRMEDAEYVIAGQGSVVANAEAVADHLRRTRKLRVGVLNVRMFRPFPADLVARLLRGRKAVAVLERVDQPLAADAPLLREIRAAMGKALENGRARKETPHAGIPGCAPDEIPDFYSGCFGLGSRDLQPGDLVAAALNMLPDGPHRRHFYLGVEFVRKGTRIPKLQIWQEKLLESYPRLPELSLASVGDLDILPEGAFSFRIHSVGGWGAITMGKNLAVTAADLLNLHVKANPRYGSEKKGQPTTFFATLAKEPIRLNGEVKHVDVVLSPDPNVFHHSNPLAGLRDGGVLVIQSDRPAGEFWASLPAFLQREIVARKIQVFTVDAFRIAAEEASDAELRYRMQGTSFLGAFFRAAPLAARHGLAEDRLFEGIRAQVAKSWGHLGDRVIEDNLRVIRRGFDEVRRLEPGPLRDTAAEATANPRMPGSLDVPGAEPGIGNPGRFWEQVCHVYKTGGDGIADPFAALSAIPAATSTIRDMTLVRREVPEFVASKCTGCGQCWTQCPDSAIPGVVNSVEEILGAAIRTAANGRSFDRMRQATKHVARETQRLLTSTPFAGFPSALKAAYETVATKFAPEPQGRAELDAEFGLVASAVAEFPLAKTAPFFDLLEGKEKGTGGLLSVTVNPEACKGCNICVAVCPDGALVTVKQTDEIVDGLRRNWRLWRNLPDTDDRYINVASLEEGIGVLPSLLLKKENYLSMVGGDGACMGCGEKTGIHLVLSAVHALMLPRVRAHVRKLDDLIERLDAKARGILASDADLGHLQAAGKGAVDIRLDPAKKQLVERIQRALAQLKDLRWRYGEGPGGKGRAVTAFANATGCSSVWGSTYPFNPYPFPWVSHLFQDAPSLAIGLFEGHMRKMADGFIAVRRGELELEDAYDGKVHEPFFARFDWHQFTAEEFALCPPIFAVGGDGAMMDIGFQNLSRLLASNKPIRVIVLDTQVYSNTGGQASTGTYTAQDSALAPFGKEHHGKEEARKELALLAIAHRGSYVLQSSQANASHLLAGVLRGLQVRRPSLFLLHCPCPPEHGLADEGAARAARLTLESRAFPLLRYDPDAGTTLAECMSLEGNPAPDDPWPTYDLAYTDDTGAKQALTLPVTIGDWAASEGRFKKQFRPLPADRAADGVRFDEYLRLRPDEREGKVPFLLVRGANGRLDRLEASPDVVRLAEERLRFWSLLRQMAGAEIAPSVREEAKREAEADLARRTLELKAEYETKVARLKVDVARRLALGLLRAGKDKRVEEIVAAAAGMTVPAVAEAPPRKEAGEAPEPPRMEAPKAQEKEEGLAIEAYIESARCTACNECTNINRKVFSYNEKKQAYVKDPRGGPYKDIVRAAERCPVRIIHTGTPLDPDEKDLAKWVERGKKFA